MAGCPPCWGFCGAPDKDVQDQCWVQGCVQPVCLMASPMLIDTSGLRAKHSLFLTVGQFWRKGTGLMTHTDEERTCSGPLRMPVAEHRVEARLLPPRINAPGKGCVHLTDLPHEGKNISSGPQDTLQNQSCADRQKWGKPRHTPDTFPEQPINSWRNRPGQTFCI